MPDASPDHDGLIIDLDGVVWRGKDPIPGAAEPIRALRARGTRVVFLTNEPGRSREEFVAKLIEMGIPATKAEILTSAAATARFLSSLDDLEGRRVLVVGPPALHEEIRTAGFELVPSDQATTAHVVVVGGHEGFDYEELLAATAPSGMAPAYLQPAVMLSSPQSLDLDLGQEQSWRPSK